MLTYQATKIDQAIVFDDKNQEKISDEMIVPNISNLTSYLLKIRKEVDEKYIWSPKYPKWYCWQISLEVFKEMYKFSKLVKDIQEKWWVFKRVYWIQFWRHFQNWIQLWNHFINPSNDSVFEDKKPVSIIPLQESWMENFSTYHRYSQIAQNYWWVKIYPNIYFPQISPMFPFFMEKEWEISLLQNHILVSIEDIRKWNLKLAESFIEDSIESMEKLPEEILERLWEVFNSWNIFENFFDYYCKHSIKEVFDKQREILKLFGEEKYMEISFFIYSQTIKKINDVLSK